MSQWLTVCTLEDIVPATGICALVGLQHVAIFRPADDEQVYALSNIDPFAQASVLSRGLIVQHQQTLWVASPLKKQRFRLSDGYCFEDANFSIATFTVKVEAGMVKVKQDA